jgi:AraC-like DNA-binding protein
MMLLMGSARGSHTIDFTDIPARPQRLIHIRPGQVQVWNTEAAFDATLVLARPAARSSRPWFPGHGSYADLDEVAAATADSLIGSLRAQQTRFDGEQSTSRLMIALFDALVALFDQSQAVAVDTHLPEVYVAFRNAMETDLSFRHDVVEYARHLGYSARTITRACQQATGQTAKAVLADRLVLEAKRLLVHTDTAAAAISAQLGFSEATNFTKFFSRNTGQSPSSFRQTYRQHA